jgi:hypothetical protein|tara:strand:- start:1104 stop:1391 length:288 start_codon:yes stop_codon:yes gene_type:complete
MLITPTIIRQTMYDTYLNLLPTELLIPICDDVNIYNGLMKHIKLQYKINKEIVNFFIQDRIFENYTINYAIKNGDILQEIIFDYFDDEDYLDYTL